MYAIRHPDGGILVETLKFTELESEQALLSLLKSPVGLLELGRRDYRVVEVVITEKHSSEPSVAMPSHTLMTIGSQMTSDYANRKCGPAR